MKKICHTLGATLLLTALGAGPAFTSTQTSFPLQPDGSFPRPPICPLGANCP